MPAVAHLRIRDESHNLTSAVDTELFLPSQVLDRIDVSHEMIEIEWRLRFAQAHDALHDIRRLLLVRSQMYAAKDRFSRGQRQVTRSQNLLRSVQSRIDESAQKYRGFRTALLRMARPLGKVGWDGEIRLLADTDLRGLSAKESGSSEGHVTMSWIWKTSEGGEYDPSGEGMQEGMQLFHYSPIHHVHLSPQPCVSNGAKRVPELIVGKRSAYCLRRRCEG